MGQSIQDIVNIFKSLAANDTWFLGCLLLLTALGSFGLGRASLDLAVAGGGVVGPAAVVVHEAPSAVAPVSATSPAVPATAVEATAGTVAYVGSRNGTKFHLLTCPGASQIKEENKVYFSSKQDAYSKGYTEAANCKGI